MAGHRAPAILFYLLRTGITNVCYYDLILKWILGLKPGSLCLPGKHFLDWSIFPGSVFNYFWDVVGWILGCRTHGSERQTQYVVSVSSESQKCYNSPWWSCSWDCPWAKTILRQDTTGLGMTCSFRGQSLVPFLGCLSLISLTEQLCPPRALFQSHN